MLDISQLQATTGAYFRDFDERNMFREIYESYDEVTRYLTIEDGNPDEIAKGQVTIGKVLQPRQSVWTPKGDFAFKARILKVRQAEVSVEIPNIRAMHKNFMAKFKKPGAQANNLVFESELMDLLVQQAREDLALDAMFKGVYNAAGTNPVDTIDGYATLIAMLVTAGDMTVGNGKIINTGALLANTAVAQAETVRDGLPAKWRYKELNMYASPTFVSWYFNNYRTLFSGQAPAYKEVIRKIIDGSTIKESIIQLDNSKISLIPVNGLAGSERIIVAPQKNMLLNYDSLADLETLTIEYFRRIFSIYMDLSYGVGFHTIDEVWANERA